MNREREAQESCITFHPTFAPTLAERRYKPARREAIIDYQPFQSAGMLDTSAEVSTAAKLMDWTPSTPPAEGSRLTEWHRQEGKWLDSVVL